MEIALNAYEIRVLGCLMEKSMATPEYYPLSLNALVSACNQKSNRDPVVAWDEETVRVAADGLEHKGLVNRGTTGRVPRYEECLTRQLNMVTAEAAVLCVLLLRGPQTLGQIRSRTDRLYVFDSLEAMQDPLERLMEWGFVRKLERLSGHKEARYMHLLENAPDCVAGADDGTASVARPNVIRPNIAGTGPAETDASADLIARLEKRVQVLEAVLADLKKRLDDRG